MATETVTIQAKARSKITGKGFLYNLIPNPSFEVDTSGWGLDGVFSRDNSDAYSGAYCIKLEAPDGFANMTTTNDEGSGIPVVPNTAYRFSMYYKLTNNSGNNPIVSVMRDSAFGSAIASGFPGPSGSWTRLQFTVTIPADVNKVWIKISNNGGDVIMLFDALQLEPGTSATDYKDGSIPPNKWAGTAHFSRTEVPFNYLQAKARVATLGKTVTIQARARVGSLTSQAYIQAKANIISLSESIPKQFLIPNRKGRLWMGFGSLLRRVFEGYSGMVKVTRSSRRAEVHLEDELSRLADYKLTEGDLEINIRTDRYIWGILDRVYEDHYTVIGSFDTDETWSDDGVQDTTNHRGGDGAISLQSTGSTVTTAKTLSSLDLSGYGVNVDYIDFFFFVDDISLLEEMRVKLGDSSLTNYFMYEPDVADLVTGWNQIRVLLADFTETGTPDWSDIDKVQCEVKAFTSETVNTIFDEMRAVDHDRYPRRLIDVGLQDIPVAWWAGNTSLYEIRTACEAEGARFFSDDNGVLQFWNRQHFNVNSEFKTSQWEFRFNRMFDLEYPNDQTNIINKIVVKLNPRRVVDSAEEMWRYGAIPSIPPGGTRTIWAVFNDPAPTTVGGVIEPESTTDFTANSQADGGGSDQTSNFEILEFNRFTTSARIVVKNNGGGSAYLTLLKVRGTPAKKIADAVAGGQSSEIEIRVEDEASIEKYGERPSGGMIIENKYLADEDDATALAEAILAANKDPLDRVILKARAIPQLNLGDMITVYNGDTGKSLLMRIVTYKLNMSPDGFDEELHARSVTAVESLNYFTINESAIEGDDVISP